jgi:hypothetical protein
VIIRGEVEAPGFYPTQPWATELVAGLLLRGMRWGGNPGGLGQGFEIWSSWTRMVNECKQGRPTSECGAVHVLPDEMA